MAAPPRKLARLGSLLGGTLLLVAACDPNVVIGSKLSWGQGGSDETGGSPPAVSGTGGQAVTSGSAGEAALGGAAGEGATSSVSDAGASGAPDMSDPGVIFTTGNEGSLMDWDAGPDMDAGGYYADPGVASPVYTTEQHHSGEGAAKVFINADGADKISRLYRRIGDYEEAYYLAWFYLKEDHVPSSWWSIFLFRANQNRADSTDLWSIDLVRTPQNQLTVALYEHQYDNGAGKQKGRTVSATTQQIAPVGVWFQLQAYLKAKAGQPSVLQVWLDGTQVINLDKTTPAPDGMSLYWVIGNGAGKLTPSESTVYIDDAQISTSFVRP
ncbi:MAG TPA: hypothetical protein VHB79_25420 [Polyangiaceae bacterium]|nr:hypothetical protein [Polyangiaceae bacterium]